MHQCPRLAAKFIPKIPISEHFLGVHGFNEIAREVGRWLCSCWERASSVLLYGGRPFQGGWSMDERLLANAFCCN